MKYIEYLFTAMHIDLWDLLGGCVCFLIKNLRRQISSLNTGAIFISVLPSNLSMAISHIHTSPPLLCLLEVHICSELTFSQVLSCRSRSGRPRGAGAAFRALGCPGTRLDLSCLTFVYTGLSTLWRLVHICSPILSITTALRQSSEILKTSVISLCSCRSLTLRKIKHFLQGRDQMPSPWLSQSWPTPSYPTCFCWFNYLLFWSHISIKC